MREKLCSNGSPLLQRWAAGREVYSTYKAGGGFDKVGAGSPAWVGKLLLPFCLQAEQAALIDSLRQELAAAASEKEALLEQICPDAEVVGELCAITQCTAYPLAVLLISSPLRSREASLQFHSLSRQKINQWIAFFLGSSQLWPVSCVQQRKASPYSMRPQYHNPNSNPKPESEPSQTLTLALSLYPHPNH